jgi:chromosome partitioning protein
MSAENRNQPPINTKNYFMTAKIFAVANQKGGVGKSTSTINIARVLVEQGKRVLIIDCDPQSSASVISGITPQQIRALQEQGKTLYFSLVKNVPLEDLIIGENPSVIPSSIRLSNAETEMINPYGAASVLREKIQALRERFDIILIDCPPTLSMLTVNALSASDAVLIPCKTDYLSIMGIQLLLETIENVRRRVNPSLRIAGILPTLFNVRANHDVELLEELKQIAAAQNITVFAPINRSTAFDRANSEATSVIESYPATPGVEHYRLVASHILEMSLGK